MSVYTPWWLRHCLKFQAQKTPRLTGRWPIISMHRPEGPGIAISVDYFGPLLVTPRGNTYILLITGRFSRRADMLAATTAEFAAEGKANIWSTNTFPDGGAHASYSQRPASRFVPSFHKLSTSCSECESLPQAPTTQTVTETLSG